MKKIITLILIMITPLTALASTFKTSGFEYELTKIENKCDGAEHLEFFKTSKNQDIYYTDTAATEITKLIVVQNKNNECSYISPAELLNLFHEDSLEEAAYVENSTIKIVEKLTNYNTDEAYVKTTDTAIAENKLYYEKRTIMVEEGEEETETEMIQIVSEPKVEEIANYYEAITVNFPKKPEVEASVTYYKISDKNLHIVEKVAEPKTEEIFTYLISVKYDEEEKEVKTINSEKLVAALKDSKVSHKEVAKVPGTNQYVFLTYVDQQDGDRLISVYDENGKELFKNFEGFRVVNENLYLGYHDGKTQFYSKLRVKFHTENIETLYPTNYFDNENTIYLSDGKDAYKLTYKTVPVTENPNTSDELVIVIIIGLVSLVGLSKTTSKHRRKHRIS